MKKKIHPIWWLAGVALLFTALPYWQAKQSVPNAVWEMAVKDKKANPKQIKAYVNVLNNLDKFCVEPQAEIIAMNADVAEKWMRVDPEASYLGAFVTMSNVAGAGFRSIPGNCREVYARMLKVEKQVYL